MFYLVTKDDESEIVDVVDVVLCYIDSIHVHENVSYHDHGRLVIIPSLVEGLKKIVVEGTKDFISDLQISNTKVRGKLDSQCFILTFDSR